VQLQSAVVKNREFLQNDGILEIMPQSNSAIKVPLLQAPLQMKTW